jgi:CubicO group peptidase (beta-lactamase class C family)
MRLVERGRLHLDRTVRSYLPDFRTSDPAASARVTLRQLLNHTAGWLGEFVLHTGFDDGALDRYVTEMSRLPQLTPPGRVYAYNNAALSAAGRVMEVVTGDTYESAVRTLVLDPLRLPRSAFFLDELPGVPVATSHVSGPGGEPVPAPDLFVGIPRGIHPAGGLISTARDQLRWARFHMGDGRVPGSGRRLLSPGSMRLMQSHPGPGGTLYVELDGFGVTWMLRPTAQGRAQGPKVMQHGGDLPGQHSGFMMVPERDFALTVLTNSDSGLALTMELFANDWALRRFAGVSNLPAVPRDLPAAQLAGYEGTYTAEQIWLDGEVQVFEFDIVADDGQLSMRQGGVEFQRLAFYRRDYVLALEPGGARTPLRLNFVRDPGGEVGWLRSGGTLLRRNAPAASGRGVRMPSRLSPLLR